MVLEHRFSGAVVDLVALTFGASLHVVRHFCCVVLATSCLARLVGWFEQSLGVRALVHHGARQLLLA
jgi:hypothetical protein